AHGLRLQGSSERPLVSPEKSDCLNQNTHYVIIGATSFGKEFVHGGCRFFSAGLRAQFEHTSMILLVSECEGRTKIEFVSSAAYPRYLGAEKFWRITKS